MPTGITNINLLEHDTFTDSTIGKFLTWVLSVGRYIIIFTQLIVILSFLSRFKLDRDLTNLNSDIDRQKAIILSYGNLENTFKTLQHKLAFIAERQKIVQAQDLLPMISDIVPNDVRIEQMQITPSSVQIQAIALSQQGFAQFINTIRQQRLVRDISINDISLSDQGATMQFSLNINIETLTAN